ncbi:hypothetical protein C8F01DRAFT_1343341 [Mycena amicta]|nr:hypothetical protein C8F01DRAFT_1343341 [Mycena amicta]
MDTFNDIYKHLNAVPGLCDSVGMEKSIAFICLAARLKDTIIVVQPPTYDATTPPLELPDNISSFLSSASNISPTFVHGCWTAFSSLIWTYEDERIAKTLKQDGLENSLSGKMLYPPIHYCTAAGCTSKSQLRQKHDAINIVLYTLADGACASFAHTLTCDTCHTRYYPNYSVSAGTRSYYTKIPDVIQVGTHQYVERRVLELFINLMLISWTSATNAARIYDASLSKPEEQPRQLQDWSGVSFKLRNEHVWDGVILLSLLEDCERHGRTLRVPHTGEQRDRFTQAMNERNARIQFLGQPEWGHYCNRCLRVWEKDDGHLDKIHVVVIDGITIGHPCCGVLHCPTLLSNNRDRYCPEHASLDDICAVEGCEEPAEHGYRTCADGDHRHLETMHKKRDKAMFQLRTKVARSGVSNPENVFEAEITAEEYEEMDIPVGDCPATKNPEGNRKIRALFGRRKTHNEQIIVRPCGVIVARATFFGSETVPQTADFLRKTFRANDSMADIVFYDNNCTLYKHLARINDPLMETVGFPVDVFHWQCKHKKEGVECAYHCNPLLFPELVGEGKAWQFNSSIAEQTNVWLGGYHAILREMGATKFDFFLDEMILRKNRLTVAKLEAEGACPGLRPVKTSD